jgi:Ni/Co efflux regulator RcnB
MKKIVSIVFTILFALSVAGISIAAEVTVPADNTQKVEQKKAPKAKKHHKKSKKHHKKGKRHQKKAADKKAVEAAPAPVAAPAAI